MTALVNELFEHETPVCLLLDDLHYVTHEDIHAALDFLVERLPPQVTLVIATRHDPGLALAQLWARREMIELRLEELRFTRDEAAALLNQQLGVALSAAELAALMKRTDGWAAGMTLLSAAFERLTTPAARTLFIDQLAHNNRYIFDYLAESVLNREDSATRTFLIATAIFDELHPTLCRAVTGQADADSLLHALFRRNLFVMLLETSDGSQAGASPTIYRYHDLFRDFLREQLRRQPSEYVRALHQRAAETIEQRTQGGQQPIATPSSRDECAGLCTPVHCQPQWHLWRRKGKTTSALQHHARNDGDLPLYDARTDSNRSLYVSGWRATGTAH
jgi:LuxR family maltose regulon positive regulatory protein